MVGALGLEGECNSQVETVACRTNMASIKGPDRA